MNKSNSFSQSSATNIVKKIAVGLQPSNISPFYLNLERAGTAIYIALGEDGRSCKCTSVSVPLSDDY